MVPETPITPTTSPDDAMIPPSSPSSPRPVAATVEACLKLATEIPAPGQVAQWVASYSECLWSGLLRFLPPMARPQAIDFLLMHVRLSLPHDPRRAARLLVLCHEQLAVCSPYVPRGLSDGLLVQLCAYHALTHFSQGKLPDARRILTIARSHLTLSPDPLVRFDLAAIEAPLAWAEARPDRCLRILRTAQQLAAHLLEPAWDVALCQALLSVLGPSDTSTEAEDLRTRLARQAGTISTLNLVALLEFADQLRNIH